MDLIRRYHAMRRPPQSMSIDAWISKWESIYIEAIQLEIGEVLDLSRPLFDFIEAVSTISPYFTEIWHDKLTEKQEKNEPLPPFYTITKKFRDSIKLNQTKESKRLKIAHATLQGKSDSFKSINQNDQDSTTSQTSPKRSKKRCPCEEHPNAGYHYFSDCYYINDSIKPSN